MFKVVRRTFGKDGKCESGQSMLEFAIAATVFFLLFFAAIDFGFFFFAKVTMQNAVRQAGRYAITGNCGSGGNCFGSTGNRLPIITQTVKDFSFFLNPTVTVTCISGSCPGYSGGGGGNAGGPQDVVQITATYVWFPFVVTRFVPSMFPGGSYTLSVSSIFKNEPFAPPS
jgi:TadE-like protein